MIGFRDLQRRITPLFKLTDGMLSFSDFLTLSFMLLSVTERFLFVLIHPLLP